MKPTIATLCLLVTLTAATSSTAADAPPEHWLTVAEHSGFAATASYDETMTLLRRIAARSPAIRLQSFGHSAAGRQLPLVVVSADGAFTPAAAAATGKPVVLIQSCIHAGEVDGKVASLMILRDLALGRAPDLLDAATLLFAPIYNADGHERVSPFNRPNQDGPVEGMGGRATASRLDLNRDHLKLDTVEARALASLLTAWQPHLHVDNHVTNGSDHDWVLTWSRSWAPRLAPSLDEWYEAFLPRVMESTEAAGHRTGPYVSLIDDTDPTQGFSTLADGPRFSTGYMALRNRPSILIEMHAHKPFRQRVQANAAFLAALIRQLRSHGSSLIAAVAAADARTVACGRPQAAPSLLVVRWKEAEATETVPFPVYDWHLEPCAVTGEPLLHFHPGRTRTTDVPWVHRVKPELTVARPRGYTVLPGWPRIRDLVLAHGLEAHRLTADTTLSVETLRLANPQREADSYQGRIQVACDVERRRQQRSIPAGAMWIPADQPLFELAAQLLEPEAPDSIVSWGLVNSVFERREYIGLRELEALAQEMLADPAVQSAWESALQDEGLAGNPRRRYLWWYQRTPYWDEGVGLLPVYRVMAVPDELPTEAWTAN